MASLRYIYIFYVLTNISTQIGVMIANDIFPEVIEYFLGTAGGDDIDSEEEEEDDDDEDDDEEIDLEKPRLKKQRKA